MTISNEIINKKWVLKERPIGMAKKSDFELQEEQWMIFLKMKLF